ncbi:hypothetical protein ACFQ0T_20990 [Kitasatospora gansuensis]
MTLYNGSGAPVSLIADLQGYYQADGGLAFRPMTPRRILDTRVLNPATNNALPVSPSSSVSVSARWSVGWDLDIDPTRLLAPVLNTTVTGPSSAGYLTVYPTGATVPGTSNLNFTAGQTVAAAATTPLSSDGSVSFLNGSGGRTDVIADLNGFFYR